MSALGEWVVTVDVLDDLGDSEADALSSAVLTSLTEWAADAEQRFSTSARPVRIRAES
jgi:hypothetical protein